MGRNQASKLKRYKFYTITPYIMPQLGNQTNLALWWETCHCSSNRHFSNQIHPFTLLTTVPNKQNPYLVWPVCYECAIIPVCLLTDNPNDILGFPSRRRRRWRRSSLDFNHHHEGEDSSRKG